MTQDEIREKASALMAQRGGLRDALAAVDSELREIRVACDHPSRTPSEDGRFLRCDDCGLMSPKR